MPLCMATYMVICNDSVWAHINQNTNPVLGISHVLTPQKQVDPPGKIGHYTNMKNLY